MVTVGVKGLTNSYSNCYGEFCNQRSTRYESVHGQTCNQI